MPLSSAEKGSFETEFRVTHTREGFHILPNLRRASGFICGLFFLILFNFSCFKEILLYSFLCTSVLFFLVTMRMVFGFCGWETSVWVNGKATA